MRHFDFIGLHPDMTTELRQLAPMKMAEICCHDSYVILECVYYAKRVLQAHPKRYKEAVCALGVIVPATESQAVQAYFTEE